MDIYGIRMEFRMKFMLVQIELKVLPLILN